VAIEQSQLYRQLAIANQKLQELATTDGLTGIANRRQFDRVLMLEWRRLAREELPLSLIMLDIDFFKLYNEFYGHVGGDDCLRQVAGAIAYSTKRAGDFVARKICDDIAFLRKIRYANGIWDMALGIWDMGYGIWDMGYGIWLSSLFREPL